MQQLYMLLERLHTGWRGLWLVTKGVLMEAASSACCPYHLAPRSPTSAGAT